MADEKHIIEPQRLGLWVAVAFIIALLALGLSIIAMKQNNERTVVIQAEILLLNQKIASLQKKAAPAAPAPAPAAEAASQPAP